MAGALPDGFKVRPPRPDDLEAVTELINTCKIAEHGEAEYTVEDIRSDWGWLGFELATDAWVVVAPGGQIIAYASVWVAGQIRTNAEGYVHPEYCSQGIGTYLLHLAEARARQFVPQAPPGARVTLANEISQANTATQHLLEQEDYQAVRYNWRMEIALATAPALPVWPAGITLHPFTGDPDHRAVHAAREEAFQDHRGYLPFPFESWQQRMVEREDFDPTLWFLAMDRAEIAGLALCDHHLDKGWVGQLAVRRPWRRQGLGMALLLHAFGEFYQRGIYRVVLGVDAQSLTGATRLYERAGMSVTQHHTRYEKELCPGKESGEYGTPAS